MPKQTDALRWLPALFLMAVIFWFSSQPSNELPSFSWADAPIKKLAHILEYAALTFFIWRALRFQREYRWLAWLIAVAYAATDEFHQSFTPGRFPSVWDVAIFDNLGALISIWITQRFSERCGESVPRDR